MAREIKFRAWDSERKQFVPQGEIVFRDYGDTSIEVHPNDPSYIGDSCHNGEPQRDRFIVSQFTGLVDKNGKEIYEGDILSAVDKEDKGGGWHSKVKAQGVVEYNAQWGYRFQLKDRTQRLLTLYTLQKESFEIIGNIYDNPELLKS